MLNVNLLTKQNKAQHFLGLFLQSFLAQPVGVQCTGGDGCEPSHCPFRDGNPCSLLELDPDTNEPKRCRYDNIDGLSDFIA